MSKTCESHEKGDTNRSTPSDCWEWILGFVTALGSLMSGQEHGTVRFFF